MKNAETGRGVGLMQKMVMLEFNEVNFTYVEKYVAAGELPAFQSLLRSHRYVETESEPEYANLEPWIQWVSAHTGQSFSEHKIFRLGDIRKAEIDQIWETLESRFGITVGAISPMNAENRTKNAAFFVPDPWTGGSVSGPPSLSRLYEAIRVAVNQNAGGRVGAGVWVDLVRGLLEFGRLKSVGTYISCLFRVFSGKWRKAIFLDRLLADVYMTLWQRTRPGYSTLFLNAAAHIQHHYMFSSTAYEGSKSNPEWYVSQGVDPLLEVYKLYDRILSEIMRFRDVRVLVATGLHQDPHSEVTFYYRLLDHESFLQKLGINFAKLEPRMSRDFLIVFDSKADALKAQSMLEELRSPDDERIFSVENRGKELFVILTYSREIRHDFYLRSKYNEWPGFFEDVAFVAIKNGEHNGTGYLVDTGGPEVPAESRIPITEIFGKTIEFFEASRASGGQGLTGV